MVTMQEWDEAQKWESEWHGDCINSLNEELKQITYAQKMGLKLSANPKTPYSIDIEGKSVLDIGGGAYSLLLKCVNLGDCIVTDPLMDKYPQWVRDRYKQAGISAVAEPGEYDTYPDACFDEVWIYNVLQHTYDPKVICENALKYSKLVRIFEWIDTPPNVGHPHTLKENKLNAWLKGEGQVQFINERGAVGKAYYGVFKGRNFDL